MCHQVFFKFDEQKTVLGNKFQEFVVWISSITLSSIHFPIPKKLLIASYIICFNVHMGTHQQKNGILAIGEKWFV